MSKSPHAKNQEWRIEVADRGDGAYVATVTRLGEMKCRITRSSSSAEAPRAEALIHGERWIDNYVARNAPKR